MKNRIKYISVLFLSLLFTSCLKSGLDDLPEYEDADITRFRFEYRWIDYSNTYGKLQVIQLDADVSIDTESHTVSCELTVPDESGTFTQEIRDQVSLSNIVGYADLSVAAVLTPLGDSPKLGVMADFSQPDMEYEVMAADGTIKIWKLEITEFFK